MRIWRQGGFYLLVSQHILTELSRTFQDPYFRRRLSLQEIAEIHTLLEQHGVLTQITTNVKGVATHPEDNLVLATAISGHADYLVTGDSQLQRLGAYGGVTILSPRAFLDILQGGNADGDKRT